MSGTIARTDLTNIEVVYTGTPDIRVDYAAAEAVYAAASNAATQLAYVEVVRSIQAITPALSRRRPRVMLIEE